LCQLVSIVYWEPVYCKGKDKRDYLNEEWISKAQQLRKVEDEDVVF